MRIVILSGAVALAALSLSACGKKPAEGSAPVAAASAPAGPVKLDAASMPHRKAGLWKTSMSMEGAPAAMPVTEMCLDEAAEQKLSVVGGQIARDKCATYDFHRNLDGSLSFHSVCEMGQGATTDSSGTVTGDFNSKYTVAVKSVTTGAAMASMNGEHAMSITSEWEGPCKPGQKGGDMMMHGMTINVIDMQGARRGMPARP